MNSLDVSRIAVLGAGAWGTALACVLRRSNRDVHLWGRDEATCEAIANQRRNEKYLPGIDLAEGIKTTADIAVAIEGAGVIFVVVPVQSTEEVATAIRPIASKGTMLVMCSKGMSRESQKMPSEMAREILPDCDICVLSGPSFAKDVAKGLPTAVTLAHSDEATALEYASSLSGPQFRIYASSDVKGVELAGALKNVIAIVVGIARGLGLGASAEAALIARGYAEVTKLAIALGASQEALLGLAGLGDLVLSCTNTQSRNFSYGIAIGGKASLEGLPLAEGAKTVHVADAIAKQQGIDCPLIHVTKLLLDGDISLSDACDTILARPIKVENQ